MSDGDLVRSRAAHGHGGGHVSHVHGHGVYGYTSDTGYISDNHYDK